MSKRYGRNQKRKHRQQIAELENQILILNNEKLYFEDSISLARQRTENAINAKEISK